jgi:deoxyribonuclease-4
MPPAFFHLNDSQGACGSNKDRHAVIGGGLIGAAPFGWLLRDRRAQGVPLVLETPQALAEVGEEDDTPDPWDVAALALLRGMAAAPPPA